MGHVELVGLDERGHRHDAGAVTSGIGHLPRIGPDIGHELGQGVDRQRGRHHQVEGEDAQVGDRREIGHRVVGRALLERGHIGHRRGGAEVQRVTIGCGLGHLQCSNRAIGAGAVFNQHRFAKGIAHVNRDGARAQVGAAARREGHHESDRFGRPVALGTGQAGQCGCQRDRGAGGEDPAPRC